MKKENEYPRNFRSSSAAYRAIRQYEEKKGIEPNQSGLVMTKNGINDFTVDFNKEASVKEIEKRILPDLNAKETRVKEIEKRILSDLNSKEIISTVELDGLEYRFFPNGIQNAGYYEIKTGNRRRPNSKFISLKSAIEKFYL